MLLRALLFLTVALPALAISMGRADGRIVFVLYREPKMVAAVCLSWLLLATLAWTRPEVFRVPGLLVTARRPAVAIGLALGAWLALTRLWVRVPENWAYEALQYATFGLLFVALVSWARDDGGVQGTVRVALVASLGVVTVLGVWQWLGSAFPIRLPIELPPIRPDIGARHPSLMGWKNPAALAVTGQLFLLLGWVVRAKPSLLRRCLALLAGLEMAYVVSLGSRTAVLALGAGFAVVLVLGLAATRTRSMNSKTLRIAIASFALFALTLGVVAAANSGLRERLGSMVELAVSPSKYFDSDRGVYLRNTLNMARHEPLGVGLGDWQTAYPVYRKHGRDVSFDATFEVRRAHSDHVQMLGEAGWPGLALWLAWLGLLALGPARAFLQRGRRDPERLFAAAQVAALAVAMATDYVVELPYGKFQFFLVAVVVVGVLDSDDERVEPKAAARSPGSMIVAGSLTALALVVGTVQLRHLQRVQTAAEITRRYEVALSEIQTTGRVERSRLEGILVLGERFDRLPGGDKTTYRAYLGLSQTALLLERQDDAESAARRALELHPYSVDALAMMARVEAGPCAQRWRQARTRVLEEATEGYVWSYPSCRPSGSR